MMRRTSSVLNTLRRGLGLAACFVASMFASSGCQTAGRTTAFSNRSPARPVMLTAQVNERGARSRAASSASQHVAAERSSAEVTFPRILQTTAEGAVPTEAAPPPLASDEETSAASEPPGVVDIDLCRAMALAGADNPTIGLAFETIRAAQSDELAADVLALPSVRAGANVHVHRGNLLSAGGNILNVDRQSRYWGLGASAVGSGTVTIPGVRVVGHVADAWYEPQVAEQRVTETRFDAAATRNAILLDVAVRYYELLGALAEYDALILTRDELRELAKQTGNFVRTGQGRQADADRAASELELIRVQLEASSERIHVAAAELARLLHLNPACELRPAESLEGIDLDCIDDPLEVLVQKAVASRPEIGARSAAIGAAITKRREECVRPFLPILSAGYSTGDFAGGTDRSDPRFEHSGIRDDFDAYAVWSLDGLGFGNYAIQKRREAEVGQARAQRIGAIDRVRREVAEAHATVAARRLELAAARRARESAEEGYRLDAQRSRNLEGLPIELLNSINLLSDARLDEVRALTSYNQAQFRLWGAIGLSPSAVCCVWQASNAQ